MDITVTLMHDLPYKQTDKVAIDDQICFSRQWLPDPVKHTYDLSQELCNTQGRSAVDM